MVRRGIAKRDGEVYACPYALRMCKSCPEYVVLYVEKCEKGFVQVIGEKN